MPRCGELGIHLILRALCLCYYFQFVFDSDRLLKLILVLLVYFVVPRFLPCLVDVLEEVAFEVFIFYVGEHLLSLLALDLRFLYVHLC